MVKRGSKGKPKAADAVRALIATAPPPEELMGVIFTLPGQTGAPLAFDRYVAILGAAIVEQGLRHAIERHLSVGLEPGELASLFENPDTGIFSTFSARINAAYGLGVIDKEEKADLTTIRNIRNLFAHSAHSVGFDMDEVNAHLSFNRAELREGAVVRASFEKNVQIYSVACALYYSRLFTYVPTFPDWPAAFRNKLGL